MLSVSSAFSCQNQNASKQNVGNSATFLVFDLAAGITGDNFHIDYGSHTILGPGRTLDILNFDQKANHRA